MGAINGRPVDQPSKSIERRLNGHDKQIEMILRELVNGPKPVAPAVAGTMQGFTRATSTQPFIVGSTLRFRGWTFDSDLNYGPGAAPGLSVADAGQDFFGLAESGYYSVRCSMQGTLTGVSEMRIEWNNNGGRQGGAQVSYDKIEPDWGNAWFSDKWVGPMWWPSAVAPDFEHPIGFNGYWQTGQTPGTPQMICTIDVWRLG